MKKTTSFSEKKYDTAYEVNQKLQTVSAEFYKNKLPPVVGELLFTISWITKLPDKELIIKRLEQFSINKPND
ncbi:hypothetical protein J4228_04450 [Candidatus Woesearchaeota archaeon]|nr:hypothetical protein [Candidatus Woesearchaeota archaeon]